MTAYDGKKPTFFEKLFCVFKPKRTEDIVSYADKILDDYTGVTRLRLRQREKRRRKTSFIGYSLCFIALIAIMAFSFKIFF